MECISQNKYIQEEEKICNNNNIGNIQTPTHTHTHNNILNPKFCLTFIEECLKKEKIKDIIFVHSIFVKLLNIEGKDNFLKLIQQSLKEKKFVFLRHAQAEHNEYNIYFKDKGIEKPKFFDPKITTEGVQQFEEIKKLIQGLNFKIEVVFISPLRRTLQTLNGIKEAFGIIEKIDLENSHNLNTDNDNDNDNDNKFLNNEEECTVPVNNSCSSSRPTCNNFIVTELLREIVTNPDTHFGHELSLMKKVFGYMEFLNYEYISKENWWSYESDDKYIHITDKKKLKGEENDQFKMRLALFVLWFIFREEKHACIISHGKVYKHFLSESKKAKNGGCYIIDNEFLFNYLEKFIDNILDSIQ